MEYRKPPESLWETGQIDIQPLLIQVEEKVWSLISWQLLQDCSWDTWLSNSCALLLTPILEPHLGSTESILVVGPRDSHFFKLKYSCDEHWIRMLVLNH